MDDAVTTSAAQSEGPEPSAVAELAQASTDDVGVELERAVNEPVPADDELHVSSKTKTQKPKLEQVFEVSLDPYHARRLQRLSNVLVGSLR